MENLGINIKQLENLLRDPTDDRESDDEFDKVSDFEIYSRNIDSGTVQRPHCKATVLF